MPSRSSIVVRNLPRKTTVGDVQTFFDTRIRDAEPKVFPLVQDTQNLGGNFLCTTVTLRHSFEKNALKLNGDDFIPAAGGGRSKILIDASFRGSITLAEHNNPQFDLYFVHGVGGDAFSSWVCESTHHMWPRDSFAEQSLSMGVRGRFSTLGYDAKVLDDGEPKTIQSTAESILSYIRADRPPGCTRPIFLVCHSLGGIVVTQALVLALSKPAIKPEYEFIQHMVGGVAFFGTPFQGTRNADLTSAVGSLIGTLSGMNTNFLHNLKTSSRELPKLTMLFNNIKTEEGIEVLVFVEKRRDGPSKVTTRTSAILPFVTEIAPIEIDADHRDMVKFASPNEARHTITEIINMIKRKLGLVIIPEVGNVTARLSVLPVSELDQRSNKSKDENAGFSQLSQFDTIFVIDDSGSMQEPANSREPHTANSKSRWDVLTRSLQYIAQIAAEYDKDGVDINFLISTHLDETNITNGQVVLNLLSQVNLEEGVGGTYLEPALADILGPHVACYETYFEDKKKKLKTTKPKPLNIIVLTDGKADDAEDLESLLVRIARQFDKMNAPRSQVGIQFLQVGDDEEAAKFLEYLDDTITNKYNIRDVSLVLVSKHRPSPPYIFKLGDSIKQVLIEKKQFIDTKTFKDFDDTHQDFTENLRRILLGAVNRSLD